MRKAVFAALTAGIALAGCDASVTEPVIEPDFSRQADRGKGEDQMRTYRVTVYNLTSTQALTPPLVATHNRRVRFFRVGHRASAGIQQIAENGNL